MGKEIKIRCRNNGKTLTVAGGSTLEEMFGVSGLNDDFAPVCAKVNNRVEGMHYRCYQDRDVEFLNLTSASGLRTYTRSVFFVLCKAVHDIYENSNVTINIPVSNGYFCQLSIGREITADDVEKIRRRMDEIIADALPIHHHHCTTEEAIEIFRSKGSRSKVKLLKSIGTLYTTYYTIDNYPDYYYGAMLTNTSQIRLYGVEKYFDGLLLRVPSTDNPTVLGEVIRQDKMFEVFKEHHRGQDIVGLSTVGDFNEAVAEGKAVDIVNVSEALQEKTISRIAEHIARRNVRMVLIAGPSSSGKTTTCKRLSVQLICNGIHPVGISLDDYFVDREKTPRDEKGDYDYEHLHALNIQLINEQFTALFNGEEVELPRYNFLTGRSEKSGNRLQLKNNEVLVVEGIHALNPELTAQIPENLKFRIYASALTTILLDRHNYIPTTDNRLLRRIIRDNKYRGVDARETIRRWPSVRKGEKKWIFPYQENADVMFNTAMLYELAVIRQQAIPLLEQVPENCDEYSEAHRLLKFLRYFTPLTDRQLPPTSLLREFLGGSSFTY
ncbi:MAG: nucleoside kinase [Prevotella sp.]|nr:nucleoside kinase [Prevotella sp.]MBR1526011.1 nucleoside kinase [Prevotella sp.]